MYKQIEKSKENQSRAAANSAVQKKNIGKQGFGFADNRHGMIAQSKMLEMANNSPQTKQAVQLQKMANNDAVNSNRNTELKTSEHNAYLKNVNNAYKEYTSVAQLAGPGAADECTYDAVERVAKNIGGSVLSVLGVLIGKSTGMGMLVAGAVTTGMDEIFSVLGTAKFLWPHANDLEKQMLVGLHIILWLATAGLIYEGSEGEENTNATSKVATWVISIALGVVTAGVNQLIKKTQNTIKTRMEAQGV